jgi:hypothetical protein
VRILSQPPGLDARGEPRGRTGKRNSPTPQPTHTGQDRQPVGGGADRQVFCLPGFPPLGKYRPRSDATHRRCQVRQAVPRVCHPSPARSKLWSPPPPQTRPPDTQHESGRVGATTRSITPRSPKPRVPMLSVVAAASTATVYLKEDFSGDCARLPLEPGGRRHRLSKPVL